MPPMPIASFEIIGVSEVLGGTKYYQVKKYLLPSPLTSSTLVLISTRYNGQKTSIFWSSVIAGANCTYHTILDLIFCTTVVYYSISVNRICYVQKRLTRVYC